ncbi:MAG: CoB--CoM heterodisulfide reductase subunit B [Deltaproteobacteria bacterium]|nr:CoB--CoM heterodisulfide reductase subunit B [Deltaproteobacteria bacterium]
MKTSLFTGCVIPIRYPGVEVATRELAARLGVEFVDVKFGCCPAPTGLKAAHFDAYLALAARNLCLAEEKGLDVVTICSGCTNTLREANHILAEDEKKRLFVHDLLKRHGKHFKGGIGIRHLADFLATDELLGRIREKLERPLTGLKVGTHYGCHYYRPTRMMRDEEPDPRYPLPESMELVLEALGAEVVEYNRQDLCCGAALGINAGRPDEALRITEEKLGWMAEAGLEALVTACPTCFTQFDVGQVLLRRRDKERRLIPVYHVAELVAYSLGADPARLDFKSHKVKTPLAVQDD